MFFNKVYNHKSRVNHIRALSTFALFFCDINEAIWLKCYSVILTISSSTVSSFWKFSDIAFLIVSDLPRRPDKFNAAFLHVSPSIRK